MDRHPDLNESIDRKKWRTRGIARAWLGPWIFAAALGGSLPAARLSAQALEPESRIGGSVDHAAEDAASNRFVFLRPHAGVGWASAYHRSGNALALHAGGRLLFPAPLSPKIDAKFGLEATYLQLDITGREIFSERYAAVGVVLEMTVVQGFNLGIGTLGYVGVGGTESNPFGVVTNLGWEPTWDTRVRPYITMRSEWIFDRATYSVLSLSAGITVGI